MEWNSKIIPLYFFKEIGFLIPYMNSAKDAANIYIFYASANWLGNLFWGSILTLTGGVTDYPS